MSTTFNFSIVCCVEALYLGVTPPSDQDKLQRFSLLFTSFISTTEKVFSPDIAAELLDETFTVKLDKDTLSSILVKLKPKTFYRLILGVRPWMISGKHGMSFKLIDFEQASTDKSIFKPYIGKLKDVAIDSTEEIQEQQLVA